ncbi:MAG: oligosaccharide flippase family protein [Prevotella sp.]|nr:oligosaccharide flippase family protein [Prevotella sp.]
MEKHTGSQRTSLLRKNIAASFLIKGWSAVIVLLMVPLTLKILGVYSNGVWLTISSILIWIDLMDIGLGNGLRNAVAKYVAMGDDQKVRQAISSTFFMLAVIVLPFLLLGYAAIFFFDVYDALGVDPTEIANLKDVLFVAITISLSTFVLKVTGNFYMGLQLPAVNSLIICLGHTLALVLTFALYISGSHSLLLVVLVNTASLLILWAVCIPYTFKKRYPQYCPSVKCIDLKMARSLFSTGLQFFTIQICGVILFMTTNIIISKALSPAEVTPYQVAYRYFNIAFVLFSTICIPFWNATTDAYTRKDYEWIRNSSKKLNLLMAGIFIMLLFMVLVSDITYNIWIGSDVTISHELSIATAVYVFILCYSQRYSYILNGLNVLRIQLVFIVIAAAVFLPLAWYACKTFQTVTSLVWVMCAVNIPGLLANIWKYHTMFRRIQATE